MYQLRRYFIDASIGVTRSSFFQMADMWEGSYATTSKVIKKVAAHGILNGLTYTPKKSNETITNLSTIFSGDIKPTENFMLVDIDSKSPVDMIACQKMTFEKDSIPLYAYYYPSSLADRTEITFNATVTVLNAFENPVLIDPLSGEVFEAEEPNFSGYGYYEYKLPIKDYPLILTDKSAFEFD